VAPQVVVMFAWDATGIYALTYQESIPRRFESRRRFLMCLTETYSGVRVGIHLSDMFPVRNGLKQGDALSPLLFNCALVYAIRSVRVNQGGLKLNGTHHRLVYADQVNILGGIVRTLKENAEALVMASKEIGLEVNCSCKGEICIYLCNFQVLHCT